MFVTIHLKGPWPASNCCHPKPARLRQFPHKLSACKFISALGLRDIGIYGIDLKVVLCCWDVNERVVVISWESGQRDGS